MMRFSLNSLLNPDCEHLEFSAAISIIIALILLGLILLIEMAA